MFAREKTTEGNIVKLSGPEFIPVAPVSDRVVRPVPRMSGVPQFDTKEPDARRVFDADFAGFNAWLIPKLAERYGRSPDAVVGYLKQAQLDRHHAFFRHADAVLLVYADIAQLETRPVVREIFGRVRATKADSNEVRKAQQEQLIELYRLAHEWAKSIKACVFRYGDETDLPQSARYDVISNSVKKDYSLVLLP